MLILGNKKLRLCVGAQPVKAAYLGTSKIYPNASLAVTESLSFEAAGGQAVLSIQTEEAQEWNLSGVPSGWSVSATTGAGPASVTITAPNNTSTAARNGTLTVVSDGLTALCSLSQAAGEKLYGPWINDSIHIAQSLFPAAGGEADIYMNIHREWTWNGVSGSGETTTSTSNLHNAEFSVSGISLNTTSGNPYKVVAGSLGTTFKAATTITVTAGSAQNADDRKSTTFTQAANCVTAVRVIGSRIMSYAAAPAAGGNVTPTFAVPDMDQVMQVVFASGATAGWNAVLSGGSWSISSETNVWTGATGTFTALDAATGTVTVASKGTSLSTNTTGPVVTRRIYYRFTNLPEFGGAAVNADTYCPMTGTPTQEANYITSKNQTPGTLYYAPVPASGGRSNPETTYQTGLSLGFSSGATTEDSTIPAGYTQTIHNTWSGSATGATLGATWGEVVWSQNNSTNSRSITVTRKAYVVLTPNTSNYPGAPTVTSNTQTYIGTCTQAGMTANYNFRYSYSNQASKYPRFAVNGVPGGGLLRAIGGIGTPIHMQSYREAITKVLGTTTSYLNGEPQLLVLDPESLYIGSGYISGWSDSSYAMGFILGQQGNFMNNYPYKYVTESFRVTGSDFTLSGIALFEKNYGDYEAAGYKWYVEANTSSPYALSADEARAVQQLAENGVVTTEDDPELASVDFEALAAKINALRQPDTDTYVLNEDGTWTIVSQENENTTL